VQLTPEQEARIGATFPPDAAELLTVGAQYLVIGLQYDVNSIIWGTGAWIQLQLPAERLLFAPLCLFDIVDGRPARLWHTRLWEDGSITLWPPPFYRDYFHDDIKGGVAAAVADLRRAVELLQLEAEAPHPDRALDAG